MIPDYHTCVYCQQPNTIVSDPGDQLSKCLPCHTYYHFNKDEGLHIFTIIYFQIKAHHYKYAAYHQENRMRLSFIDSDENPISSVLIDAHRIPDWTPQNIVEKVTLLLPFV